MTEEILGILDRLATFSFARTRASSVSGDEILMLGGILHRC